MAQVAEYIKQCKTPEEIRKRFNIKNDFTPEEEEEVHLSRHATRTHRTTSRQYREQTSSQRGLQRCSVIA